MTKKRTSFGYELSAMIIANLAYPLISLYVFRWPLEVIMFIYVVETIFSLLFSFAKTLFIKDRESPLIYCNFDAHMNDPDAHHKFDEHVEIVKRYQHPFKLIFLIIAFIIIEAGVCGFVLYLIMPKVALLEMSSTFKMQILLATLAFVAAEALRMYFYFHRQENKIKNNLGIARLIARPHIKIMFIFLMLVFFQNIVSRHYRLVFLASFVIIKILMELFILSIERFQSDEIPISKTIS